MANLLQYFQSSRKVFNVGSFYYVCGDSVRGKELVLDDLYHKAKPQPRDYVTFSLSTDGFDAFYQALRTITKVRRLVQLREAQLLTDDQWTLVLRSVAVKSSTTLVLVSNDPSPKKTNEERYNRIRQLGKAVICRPFSSVESAVKFISFYLQVTDIFASYVIEKVGFDTELLLAEVDKLALIGVKSIRQLDPLLPKNPKPNLVEMLYNRDPLLNKMRLDDVATYEFLQAVERDLVQQAAIIGLTPKSLERYQIAQRVAVSVREFKEVEIRANRVKAEQLALRLLLVSRAQHLYNVIGVRKGLKDWFIRKWKRIK